jgi:predicted RNase H-like HicB family nuclease
MRTYTFKVVVEPDDGRWHAHCPALDRYGAATWGDTEEEAFQNIREVVQMVVEELREDGIERSLPRFSVPRFSLRRANLGGAGKV